MMRRLDTCDCGLKVLVRGQGGHTQLIVCLVLSNTSITTRDGSLNTQHELKLQPHLYLLIKST